uniref:Uncharacterized protein n=1 Tax=Setaria viridis TaxID=4556 RepID=A0A4U6VLY5_SETVI|nr:hypothetical protein SEVIR_3G411100v2 [Setaria viridis]
MVQHRCTASSPWTARSDPVWIAADLGARGRLLSYVQQAARMLTRAARRSSAADLTSAGAELSFAAAESTSAVVDSSSVGAKSASALPNRLPLVHHGRAGAAGCWPCARRCCCTLRQAAPPPHVPPFTVPSLVGC